MDEVQKGGYTAFPYLKLRIPAVKNAAVFWYNLLPSGEGDSRTRHAACPVILGEKWVVNKWITILDQTFTRPCQGPFVKEDAHEYLKEFF